MQINVGTDLGNQNYLEADVKIDAVILGDDVKAEVDLRADRKQNLKDINRTGPKQTTRDWKFPKGKLHLLIDLMEHIKGMTRRVTMIMEFWNYR